MRPTAGSGQVLGAPLGDRRARAAIGYLPELFRYQPWLHAREVLALHAELGRRPDRAARRARSTTRSRSSDWSIARTIRVSAFSKGMQQRLGLGVALLGDPDLVLLDEPTSALDPVGRTDVRAIVRAARDRGATVILNSHLLTEVERVCDRVIILDHGRIIASGSLDEVVASDGRSRARHRPRRCGPGGRRGLRPRDARRRLALGPSARRRADPGPRRRTRRDRRPRPRRGAGARLARGTLPGAAGGSGRCGLVIVIARLTVKELIRRRVVWVLTILTVVSVALVGWGLDRLVTLATENGSDSLEIQIGVSQVLILVAFMFSFVLAITAAFVGAPAIGGDLESGVAYAILARPLRRADLLLGRWLGSAVVVGIYAAASGLLAIGVTVLLTGYGPPDPFLAVSFLVGEALVLLTLTLALGSVLPSIAAGAIAVVGFGIAWMAGVMAGVGAALGVAALGPVAEASRWLFPTDGLWRGVIYGLEPSLVVLMAAGRAPQPRQRQPVLRRDPAATPVRDLVDRLDGAGPRRRDVVVRPPRPLTGLPR